MQPAQMLSIVGCGALSMSASAAIVTPGGQNNGDGFLHLQNIVSPITNPSSIVVYTDTNAGGVDKIGQMHWYQRMRSELAAQRREVAFGNGSSPGGVSSSGFFVGDLTGNQHTGGMDFFTNDSLTGAQTFSQQRWTMTRNADLIAQVDAVKTIHNSGPNSITMEIFALVDLNISGPPGNDRVFSERDFGFRQIDNSGLNPAARVLPFLGLRGQTEFLAPSAMQADDDGAIFSSLADEAATTLDNSVAEGVGDVMIAFQWTFTLEPGQSATMGYSFGFVPAPGSAALALGGVLAALRRRR